MSVRAKFSAVLLVSGSLLAAAADANEFTAADVASYYVQSAVATTTYEIANDVYASILNASHSFDLEQSEIETRVIISSTDEKKSDSELAAE